MSIKESKSITGEPIMEPTEVELETTENQYWIDKCAALERLEKNPDFQSLILEGYFKDRSINGVSMLADDGVKRQGQRPDVMEMLVAVSQLMDYFRTVKNLGSLAIDEEEDLTGPDTE